VGRPPCLSRTMMSEKMIFMWKATNWEKKKKRNKVQFRKKTRENDCSHAIREGRGPLKGLSRSNVENLKEKLRESNSPATYAERFMQRDVRRRRRRKITKGGKRA